MERVSSKVAEMCLLEYGEGWDRIVQKAVDCIESHLLRNNGEILDKLKAEEDPFQYWQIKEKFGSLRIYVSYHDDYILGVIAMAESMSKCCCEITGEPGKMYVKGYCLRTLSPSYAKNNGYIEYGTDLQV